jgi:hypothetical protein
MGLICKCTGIMLAWKCNLEQIEAFKWEIGGLGPFWNYFLKTRGLKSTNGLDSGLILEKLMSLKAKGLEFRFLGIYFPT